MPRPLAELSDTELQALAQGAPSLEQFDDAQLAALAVHQGLLQPEEAHAAIVSKKQRERAPQLEGALPAAPTDEELRTLPAEAIESRFTSRTVGRVALTRGGRVGDVAAQVLAPMAGAVAGGLTPAPGGAIVGGAAGGAAGDVLAQQRQYFRGERDAIGPGEVVAAAIGGGVPLGRLVLPAGRPLAEQVARAAGRRAVQGAAVAAGSTAVGQVIDTGRVDFPALAATGALGAVFGAGFGTAELAVQRALTLNAVRRTPEFADFTGTDAELIAAVRAKLAQEAPPAPPEQNVTPRGARAPAGAELPPGPPAKVAAVAPDAPPPPLAQLTDAQLLAAAQNSAPNAAAAGLSTLNSQLSTLPSAGAQITAPAALTDTPAPTPEGISDSAAGQGAPESAAVSDGGQAEVIVRKEPKGATRKVGPAPDGSFDLLSEIESLGGIAPPSSVRGAGGEYDEWKELFGEGRARLLVRKGASTIDQIAAELNDSGRFNFDGVEEFKVAIRAAVAHREKLAQQLGALEYGAKFDAALFDNAGRKPGLKAPAPVAPEVLNQGDKFKIRGEPVRVDEVLEDGTVRVRDGVTREIPPGTPIYPDKGEIEKATPAAEDWPTAEPTPTPAYAPPAEQAPGQTDLFAGGETGGDTTFSLAAGEGKDYTGIVDQQADLAAAKAAQAKAQGEMFGGDVGMPPPEQPPAAANRNPRRGTSGVGRPIGGAVGMPPVPPGKAAGTHSSGPMPVAMDRILPGQVDVPTVMSALEDVVRAVGGESPIRTGRFYQNALGVFKNFADVIRLRQGDDIPTAAHEVAHAVSRFYFGSTASKDLIRVIAGAPGVAHELQALGHALYGSRRPNAGYTAEGFSELVRLWLTTEDAAKRAPAAAAWLEAKILAGNKPLAAAMTAARAKIDLWRGQGAQGRATAQMKDPPGRLQKLREFVRDNLGRQAQVEEFAPLEQLAHGFRKVSGRDLPADENPYLLASAYRKTAGVTLETMVERGMVDLWGNLTGPGLKEALARIKPEQAQDFAHYLWARRALERWSKGQNPGMAIEDAQFLRRKLENPAFIDAAQKYYAWWDGVLEYVKQASPATNGPLIDAIRAQSHDYVPLARVLDPLQAKAAAARAQGGGLYRFKGSGLPIKNIYLQSLLVAERLIARAHRDLVLNSIIDLSRHESMGWLVEKVPLTRVMETVNVEKIRRELETYGVDTSGIPADTLIQFASHLDAPAGTDPIIARKTAAGTEWYQIPADVHELLNGVETPARLGWAFELLFGAPARAFKLGTTGVRASFSLVTNPARDLPTFLLQSIAGNPASRAAAWFGAMRDIVVAALGGKESPQWELYHQLGISTANFLGGDVRQAQRQARALFRGRIYRRITSPVETFRDALSFSEAAPRLAELTLLAQEMGWKPGQKLTPAQATILRVAAKRVTTDFAAAGQVGREINRAIPFFNANIQGARAFGRAFQNDADVKQRRGALLKGILNGVMLLTLPALYNWWRNKDEEWYRMLPWRERWLYLNVRTGQSIVQVPMPPEWGASFAVLPVAALDSWYHKDPEPMKKALGHIFTIANPVDWPVLARAAKEQWQNRVEFFDRPIVPRGEIDLLPGEQRSHYSSWLATALGDVFPGSVSPRRVDAAVREVFGGAGSDLVDAPTAFMRALGLQVQEQRESEPADIPVAGRLFRRGGEFSAANQSLIDFWDDFDRYKAIVASHQHKMKATIAKNATGQKTPMPPPVPFKTQAYAQRLEAAYPAVRLLLEVAARTPQEAKRAELYRRAALQAKRVTAGRPKE